MSYSIGALAKTKDEAKAQLAEKFDDVVRSQPSHAKDREAALAAASAFIDIVTIPEGRELRVSLSGSLGWSDGKGEVFNGAGMNVSASLA